MWLAWGQVFALERPACSSRVSALGAVVEASCESRKQTCRTLLPEVIHDSLHDFCPQPDRSPWQEVGARFAQCVSIMPKPMLDLLRASAASAANTLRDRRERIERCKTDSTFRETLESIVPLVADQPGSLPCPALVAEWEEAVRRQRYETIEARLRDYSRRQIEPQRGGRAEGSGWDRLASWLGTERDKLSCLSNEALIELWCYRAFTVVDPLMVVGASAKVARLLSNLRPRPATAAQVSRGAVAETADASVAARAVSASTLPRNPQVELWRLREAGMNEAADRLEADLRSTLREVAIVRSELIRNPDGTLGSSSGARWVEFENGVRGVFKPSNQFGVNPNLEIAAQRIDHHLGGNSVPMIENGRVLDGVEGTVQLRVEGLHSTPMRGQDPRALRVFDYLISNGDRNSDNYLMLSTGRPVAIDHGVAFGPYPEIDLPELMLAKVRRSKRPHEPRAGDSPLPPGVERLSPVEQSRYLMIRDLQDLGIDRELVSRLRNTTPETWQSLVGQNLNAEQLANLRSRQSELVRAIEVAERELGPGIYRGGPFTPIEFFGPRTPPPARR